MDKNHSRCKYMEQEMGLGTTLSCGQGEFLEDVTLKERREGQVELTRRCLEQVLGDGGR